MIQAGLNFDLSGPPRASESVMQLRPDTQELRPYQVEAVNRIREQLEDNRSTLLVIPTGTGKTKVFTEIAQHWPGRVLVLAHRDELLQQAVNRIANETGERVGLEQAQFYAGDERIVVGSIQTISMPNRMTRWAPDHFGLVIADEAHHAVSKTWLRTVEHFSGAKLLGVTATPDRADEKAMGAVFDTVAYVYEIENAIKDRWLCPIKVRQVFINEINLTACRTTAGDLNQGDLNAAMAVEEALHGVAKAMIEQAGDRRSLLFTTSVENAKRMAEIMCRYREGCARSVDGKTPLDERRSTMEAHKRGTYQFLVNCMITTEGYDDPEIACIGMARPTKSRSLFAQMVGRGLRPKKGAINDCLVIEFTGNAGKHKLACSCDILGGRYPEDEVEEAKELIKQSPGMDASEALAKAHEEAEKRRQAEIAKRARVKAQVDYRTHDFNPFDVLHLDTSEEDEWAGRFGGAVASEKQIAALTKFGVDIPKGCTKQQAHRLMGACIARANKGLARYKQVRLLARYNVPALNISFARASEMIECVKQNGWRAPSREQYKRIMGKEPTAGENG